MKVPDAAIEAAAKAIWHVDGSPRPWRDLTDVDRDYFEEQARAALEAVASTIAAEALREFARNLAPDVEAERSFGAHLVAQALMNRAAILARADALAPPSDRATPLETSASWGDPEPSDRATEECPVCHQETQHKMDCPNRATDPPEPTATSEERHG